MKAAKFCGLGLAVLAAVATAAPRLAAQIGGAEFLRLGAGGRALGMGGAFVALADDETSALWNPAGLANVQAFQAYLSHISLFNNLASHNFAALAMPLAEDLALGVSWVRLGVDDIPRYSALQGTRFDRIQNPELRSTGRAQGFFGNRDDALFFTFSKKLNLEMLVGGGLQPNAVPFSISFGANLKFIHRRLDNAAATAQGVDIGAIFELLSLSRGGGVQRSLSFGVSLFDFATSKLNWNTASAHTDPLPARLVFGLGFRQHLRGSNSEIRLSLDGGSQGTNAVAFGGEYLVGQAFALRAGASQDGWSAGAGLYLDSLLLDYSFATHDLGNSHRVGGGIRF